MSSTGKKEYTLTINGITEAITGTTKLADSIKALDAAIDKQRTASISTATAVKAKTAALSDEDKAAKKLADTQKALSALETKANKDQITATQNLRTRQREVTREIALNNLAEGSIAAMGMTLTDLRRDYELLTPAQRNNEAEGGKLLEQIQALDSEYKALRESTGNFRDSVGDYKKGIQGLADLKDGLDKVGNGSTNLAASVAGSNELLDTFGQTADTVSKGAEGLYGVIALGAQVQGAYNAVVKEGIVQTAATAVVDSVRAVQAKAVAAAVALEGEATVGATVAQAAFNIVAAANPYVLIALALIAVGAGLYAFISSTDKAAETQKQANDIMAVTITQLEDYATKLKAVYDQQSATAQAALDLANAQADGSIGGLKRIRDAEDALFRVRFLNNAKQRGFYAEEIDDIDKNKAKLDELREVLNRLKTAQALGDSKLKIDIDLDGKIDNVKIEEALTSVQGAIDNLGKKVEIGVQIKADQAQIAADAATTAATRREADRKLAIEQRATQLTDLRALQDDAAKSVKDTYDQRRALIKQANDREIQDLRVRLATDTTLTATSRNYIEKNIVALRKATNKQLHDLDIQRQGAELESARSAIDTRNALIVGAEDRSRAEINTRYDRETHDLQTKLKNDTTLTLSQQGYINEQVANLAKERENELTALAAQGLATRSTQELTGLDATLTKYRDTITKFTGDTVVRSKTGLRLIDVDATKKNLAETNAALTSYVAGLGKYNDDLKASHEATLATLKAGTPEYVDEQNKYAAATEDARGRIVKAQEEIKDNTRASTMVTADYYRDLAGKISGYAQEASGIIGGITDALGQGVQSQIDALNANLDTINDKYSAVQALQDATVQNVQDTEQKLQDATGGTADALREQLADQMRARNEQAREEKKLADQKAKAEAQIAKKEKEAKRLTLIGNIASTIASGSQAVVQALAAFPPPFSYIAAAITGALAAVQVGVMTKQLAKLATGCPIVGPSHSQGGVRLGDQYEVEGGEYVTNKAQYGANQRLVEFINESTGTISAEDLVGVVPGGAPVIISSTTDNSSAIVDAINGMNFQPVVAVTDINAVNANLVTVRELSDY